jgi:pimeloyl-ACP methyl ester carboxylesterase
MGVQTWIVRARGWDAELALELARRYPASVAGVVLVNPVMAADEGQERHAAFDASVDELSSLCSSDSFCSVRYRSPKDAVASIEASLRAGGPQMVRVSSAGGGESDVPVDVELVHATIRDAMAGYTSVGSVPSQLDRMASGVFTWPARRLMERGWCLGSDLACTGQNGWSGGGEFSMGCGVPQASSGATASKSDPIGLVCGAWLEGRGDEPTRTEVASDVPVEAFVGKVDPSTSAHRVRSALMGFGHATVAEIPWVPEGVEFACLRAVDRGWFEDPQEVSIVTCPSAGIPQFADAP